SADVTTTVEAALGGTAASTILERGRAITVRVTLPGDYRNSLDALRALRTHGVRLDQVATIEYDPGQTEIDRDGLRQSIAVTARLENIDLGTAISRIRAQLARDVHLPSGMTMEFGGLSQEQQASFRELMGTLVRSRRRRFGPVLMTSLAAMRGMLPLALTIGSGAELLQPLAIAVIGGLAFALMLSLVVTPTVYAMIRRG